MKKLKNKLFFTICAILTLSLLSFIIVFNTKNYLEQKQIIYNNLNVVLDGGKKGPPKRIEINQFDKNIRFMDTVIYTVLLDKNNNIKEILNQSNNDFSNNDIELVATKILSKKNKTNYHIKNLLFEDYSYLYLDGNALIICDNTIIRQKIINYMVTSIFIFFGLEIFIILISKAITSWIEKPIINSFEKQKQFIADASHELKTPLSVIVASIEALEDNPKEVKWINNIKNESNRMNMLITDLLDLASTEKDNKKDYQNKNLSKTIELSVLTFEGKAFENNIKIKYDLTPNIMMMIDENRIKQLIEILLDNAIKHSYKNKTVNICLKNMNNSIILEVVNIGDDIPKGEEEKIFERFYRIDKSRNRKENRYGLGLAIAKNIVENHNGKIEAYSNNHKTTFKVLFKK